MTKMDHGAHVGADASMAYMGTACTRKTSGVPGVRPKFQQGKWYWMAEWYIGPGQPKRKLFSVNLYGDGQAMELAIAERQRQVAALTPLPN